MKRLTSGTCLKLLFFCLLIFSSLKILLIGYDIDEQYAITMSYRMVKGDFPVLDMWEPHQTSGFLASLLIVPYLAITNTLTGVVIYLRICGLIIHSSLSFLLYKYINKTLTKSISTPNTNSVSYAFFLTCIYFFSLPKFMFLPEFSNMQLWFMLLTILCLLRYYEEQEQPTLWLLFLAGCFMTLEVLTYPSTIIAFFVSLIGITLYRRKQNFLPELCVYIIPSVLGLLLFFGCLLSRMNPGELVSNLKMITSDGSHSTPLLTTLTTNLLSLGEVLCYLLIYGAIAALLYFVFCKIFLARKLTPRFIYSMFLIITTLVGQLIIWLFGNRYPHYPSVEYFLLAFLSLQFLSKKIYSPFVAFFVVLPFSAFMGVVLFTNHPLLVSAPYLVLSVIGILTTFIRRTNTHAPSQKLLRYVLLFWILVIIFGKVYMIRTTNGTHYTIFNDISLIRKGPAIGIIADTQAVKKYNEALYVSETFLPDNAKVLYAGSSSGIYLFNDMEFSTPSTISTPTFDEKITRYFALHPDKAPDYIICDCDLKDLRNEDSWLSQYLEESYSSEPLNPNSYFYRVYEKNT